MYCILHKYIVNTSACIKHPASAQYCVLAKIYHILTQLYNNVIAQIHYELRSNNSTYIKHPPSAQCTVLCFNKIVCCGFKHQAGASWWIFTTLDDLPVLHSLSEWISSKINEKPTKKVSFNGNDLILHQKPFSFLAAWLTTVTRPALPDIYSPLEDGRPLSRLHFYAPPKHEIFF